MPSCPSSSSFSPSARACASGFSKPSWPFCCPLRPEPKADFSVSVDRPSGAFKPSITWRRKNESPLLGSSDVIESLIGKAKQRLEANGRNELNKSILLIPCMCGELTQDLVAEALSTVSVQDVTTWVSENVGETMQSKRRREFP